MPRLSDCRKCGASASIEAIDPLYEPNGVVQSQAIVGMQVEIDCPTCGRHVQAIRDFDLSKGPTDGLRSGKDLTPAIAPE